MHHNVDNLDSEGFGMFGIWSTLHMSVSADRCTTFFVVVDSLTCQGTPLSGSGVTGFFVASSTYGIAWLLSEYIVCNCISKASALCLSLKERQEMLHEVTHWTRHIQTSQLSHAVVRLTISTVITQSHNGGLISHGLTAEASFLTVYCPWVWQTVREHDRLFLITTDWPSHITEGFNPFWESWNVTIWLLKWRMKARECRITLPLR